MKITAVDYKRKNINAYLDHVGIKDGRIVSHEFFSPTSYAEGNRQYTGQSVDCEFDLDKLEVPDGYYILREAKHASSKEVYFYFLIKNRDIELEFDSKQAMIDHACPVGSDFPELEGTPRQVDWAESIRKKCFQKGVTADYSNPSAKYWIDNYK